VIPSRNAVNLAACVRAVREHEPGLRIIVVDDGIDWHEYIQLIPDQVQDIMDNAVAAPKPFIFARNANIGIRAAGEDDVILLNDDALLLTACGFSEMQKEYYWHPSEWWGLTSSACNNVGNPNQHLKRHPPISEDDLMRDEPRTLCFVCVLIPRATYKTVGPLDERFEGYGLDDDDYSLRVRKAGLKLGIFDGCYVDHGSLTSSFRGPAGAGGDFTANMKLFIEKWGFDNWGNPRERSQFRALWPVEGRA
jgi:O-antigen biosynthesis protein